MRARTLSAVLALGAVASVVIACGSDTTEPGADPSPSSTTAPTSTSTPEAGAKDAATSSDARADSSSDGSVTSDGSTDAGSDAYVIPPGQPLNVPANTWTYVPIAGMVCGNGTPTGIAVNPSTNPNAPVFFLMMGGGACWDDVTCLGGAASNLSDQIDEPEIRADIARFPVLFDRSRADNAFANAHYVFVPYCTGDLHAGNAKKTYRFLTKSQTIEHRGARNVEAFLPRVSATFPGSTKIVLGGGSAGGFGTMLNYHRFRAAFGSKRIDILNDSGTPVQPTGSIWPNMQSAWNMTLPASCTGCTTDVRNVLPYLATQMGNDRFALLSYTQDKTIRAFTGILIPQQYENAVMDLRPRLGAKQKTFYVGGDSHVIIKQDPLPSTAAGLSAATWLQRFANDDPAWDNAGP